MVKINTSDLGYSHTKTSVFIKIIIRICFLPITIEDDRRISFKLMSKKTLAFGIIYFGCYFIISFFSIYCLGSEMMTKISEQNKIETFSVFSSSISTVSLIFPLVLAKALDQEYFQNFYDDQLTFPKQGIKTIIAFFGFIIGSVLAVSGYIMHLDMPIQNGVKIASTTLLRNVFLLSETL